MKQKHLNLFFLIPLLLLGFLTGACGKSGDEQFTGDAGKHLLNILNNAPFFCDYKVKPTDISTKAIADNQFEVTFKNVDFIPDARACKIFGPLPENLDDLKLGADEITFIYGPDENFLRLAVTKGVSLEMPMMGLDVEGKKSGDATAATDEKKASAYKVVGDIKINVKSFTTEKYNLSPLLTHKSDDYMELLLKLFESTSTDKGVIEGVFYEINSREFKKINKDKPVKIVLETSKFQYDVFLNPSVVSHFYIKDSKGPDFKNLLEKKTAVVTGKGALDDLKLTVHTGAAPLVIQAEDLSGEYELKPNDKGTAFVFDWKYNLKNLLTTWPTNKTLETLLGVKELGGTVSLENLSTGFLMAYYELYKKQIEMSGSDPETIKQQTMIAGMNILSQFMQSKPRLSFSFSPFVHSLGALDLKTDINFEGFTQIQTNGFLKIYQFAQFVDTLKKTEGLSGKILEGLTAFLTKHVKVDDKGDGSIAIESRSDSPGKIFLNGTPFEMGKQK